MTATGGALKAKINGVWTPIAATGAQGPQGIQGPTGVSTIIVGNYGQSKTPADLPVDGALPADWDIVGTPAHQMVLGESLIYLPVDINDPVYGHLYQFVDAANPTGWIDIGLIAGPQGPMGPTGATGPIGPIGPMSDDIHVGPADPTTLKPTAQMWLDTDDTRTLGPHDLPNGGLANQALIKASDADGDLMWSSGIHTGEAFRKTLQGPWNGTGEGSKFDVTLESRRYLVMFSVSAMCSATGAKWHACSLDGSATPLEYTRVWMNEVNSHKMMSTGTAIIDVAAGPHSFAIGLNSSASGMLSDQNDWGSIIIIPLPPL
jgi:hypothetical protein